MICLKDLMKLFWLCGILFFSIFAGLDQDIEDTFEHFERTVPN